MITVTESGAESALALLDGMLDFVRGAGLAPLARILSAMRVSFLIDAGRADEAQRFWGEAALPVDARACLDLERQT